MANCGYPHYVKLTKCVSVRWIYTVSKNWRIGPTIALCQHISNDFLFLAMLSPSPPFAKRYNSPVWNEYQIAQGGRISW